MRSKFENPYLTALHELLQQHSRSLQQPLKGLSARLDSLEVEAAKESEFQEVGTLFVETSNKEQYWLNYAQIATVAVLPRNTSGGWIPESAISQGAERKIIVFLTQPWNTAIITSIHRIGDARLDNPTKKESTGDSVAFAANVIAKSIAQRINRCEMDKLSASYKLNKVDSHTLELRIEAVSMR